MPLTTIPIKVSALHEILKWSASRPEWQRDALRRIIVQEKIESADIEELDHQCRYKHKALTEGEAELQSVPLTSSHLPPAPGEESAVVLVSLGDMQHVNRLPSNQTLTFGSSPGLCVIYGDNGSGKSGYARVLKKACRFRGSPPVIKPNAYQPAPAAKASATITCRIGGVDTPIDWKDGEDTNSLLSNVFTFDGTCASHYLTEDGPASFTPHGLDVLPKLSSLCDRVRERIQGYISTEKAAIDATSTNWKTTATTPVGILIASLSEKTKTSDIDSLATMTDLENERLVQLNETLKSNPKQKAKETRAIAARLRVFSNVASGNFKSLSDDALKELRKQIDEAKSTGLAAKAFSEKQFDETFLEGTGSEVWKAFWDAAELFSEKTFPGIDFPNTSDEARCLLCQRSLDEESRTRFESFRVFCKDESQKLAVAAATQLDETAALIKKLNELTPEFAKIEADLDGFTEQEQDGIRKFVKTLDKRLSDCKALLSTSTWTDMDAEPLSIENLLSTHAISLDERASTEESADDPVARAKLIEERDALADRKWLVTAKKDVEKQLDRLKRVAALTASQKDTTTNAITSKSVELTKEIVTEAFCQQFKEEVKHLGLNTITVELQEAKGKKGETRFGLRLKGADGHAIHDIASEGEQRCIGLAAFLAELSQASHKSALVFDDPVSSLDHGRRERIAKRLFKESQLRQVVVFTHETTFLNDLIEAAKEGGTAPSCCYLEWSSSQPGTLCDGLPWDHLQPEERLKHMDECLAELKKQWSPQPTEKNRNDIKTAYSKLRNTLERVVENVLLANVVFRFRRKLNMNALTEVLDLTKSECEEVLRLYQRCHNLIDGHDTPSGQQVATAEPDDLDKDIVATKTIVANIRTRRKAAAKAAKSQQSSTSSSKSTSASSGT